MQQSFISHFSPENPVGQTHLKFIIFFILIKQILSNLIIKIKKLRANSVIVET